MTDTAVDIVGVKKNFDGVQVLDNINLEVREHEFVSLLGPSGCGKSTLLRIISGFESPTGGAVHIHGNDVTSVPPHRRPTNIMFQRGALFPHMNVFENISYSLRLRKWSKARIADKVAEMLALVRMDDFGHRAATELSGGQVQRVALARALAAEPSVLLLDEPLSALDLKLRQQMQLELRAIQKKLEATFIFVTHDQTEALAMSDRIAVMNHGQIIQYGTPREIYTRPETAFASDFIGETNLLDAVVQGHDGEVATLQCVGGLVTATSAEPLETGAQVTVSVRPEAIRVSGLETSEVAASGVRGQIVETVYLGSSVRVGARVDGGAIVWADLRDEEVGDLAAGRWVDLRWSPSAATVWGASGGQG